MVRSSGRMSGPLLKPPSLFTRLLIHSLIKVSKYQNIYSIPPSLYLIHLLIHLLIHPLLTIVDSVSVPLSRIAHSPMTTTLINEWILLDRWGWCLWRPTSTRASSTAKRASSPTSRSSARRSTSLPKSSSVKDTVVFHPLTDDYFMTNATVNIINQVDKATRADGCRGQITGSWITHRSIHSFVVV